MTNAPEMMRELSDIELDHVSGGGGSVTWGPGIVGPDPN
jgi:hypothetical protein